MGLVSKEEEEVGRKVRGFDDIEKKKKSMNGLGTDTLLEESWGLKSMSWCENESESGSALLLAFAWPWTWTRLRPFVLRHLPCVRGH